MRPHRRQLTRLPRPWDSPGKNTGVGCHFLLQCMKVKSESEVAQSCPTLSDPMDCSLTGSSVHGILQASVLDIKKEKWHSWCTASRAHAWSMHVHSASAGEFFTINAAWEAQSIQDPLPLTPRARDETPTRITMSSKGQTELLSLCLCSLGFFPALEKVQLLWVLNSDG